MTNDQRSFLARREFLALGAGSLAALACGDNESLRDLAVAVLEPSETALLVAIWARAARAATIELRDDAGVREIPVELAETGVAAIDVTGLAAATRYELAVVAGGLRAGPYHVMTAPAVDAARPIRFAVVADLDQSDRYDNDLVEHLVSPVDSGHRGRLSEPVGVAHSLYLCSPSP